MSNLDEPRFRVSDVADAAGMSTSVLRSWINRKYFLLGANDAKARVAGSSHLLTLRRAYQIGIAAVIWAELETKPEIALAYAAAFTDAGRMGQIFPAGHITLLTVSSRRAEVRGFGAAESKGAVEVLANFKSSAALVVIVNQITEKIDQKLGVKS